MSRIQQALTNISSSLLVVTVMDLCVVQVIITNMNLLGVAAYLE